MNVQLTWQDLYWKVVSCDGESTLTAAPSNPIPTSAEQQFAESVPFGATGCNISVSEDPAFAHSYTFELFSRVIVVNGDSGAGYQCEGNDRNFAINATC